MTRFFFHISYNGTNYRGWQKLPGIKSVQKEIEIKREIINADCKLSPAAVELYNRAVKGADNE